MGVGISDLRFQSPRGGRWWWRRQAKMGKGCRGRIYYPSPPDFDRTYQDRPFLNEEVGGLNIPEAARACL